MNSNQSNLAFEREIDHCRRRLQGGMRAVCGYQAPVLLDRLMQRLTEIGLAPYARTLSALRDTGTTSVPRAGTRIDCGAAILETDTGRVTVAPKHWLAQQFDFVLHWCFCLLAILAVRRSRGTDIPAVLVHGIGEDNLFKEGGDQAFVNYCRSGPVAPLRDGRRLIVESVAQKVSTSDAFSYARKPLIELVRAARLGPWRRMRLVTRHAAQFWCYWAATIRAPQLALLGKDFAYSSIAFELDRIAAIDAVVLTCSSYTCQPLWQRALSCRVHMIWYAQNWRPIAYVTDNLRSDVPYLRWIRVDTHWVWTHAFARYLRQLGHPGAVEVVGPIVWCMPEITYPPKDSLRITVFDVPPFHDEVALRLNGEISNYFNPANLFLFMEHLLALRPEVARALQVPVSLRLKMKRGYRSNYDKRYFDYIEKLATDAQVSLAHHSDNIYSLISGSHLVVVYPFSSPAYAADFLAVPSVYYDPTQSVCHDDFGDAGSMIRFVNSRERLQEAALSILHQAMGSNGARGRSTTAGARQTLPLAGAIPL